MFVVARAVYSILVHQQIITALDIGEGLGVQSALYWSEKLRNLSGILLVVTALCEWMQIVSNQQPLTALMLL